jgi:hypothetical protein
MARKGLTLPGILRMSALAFDIPHTRSLGPEVWGPGRRCLGEGTYDAQRGAAESQCSVAPFGSLLIWTTHDADQNDWQRSYYRFVRCLG